MGNILNLEGGGKIDIDNNGELVTIGLYEKSTINGAHVAIPENSTQLLLAALDATTTTGGEGRAKIGEVRGVENGAGDIVTIVNTTQAFSRPVLKFSVAPNPGELRTVQCSGPEIVALAALLRVEAYKLSHKDEKPPF